MSKTRWLLFIIIAALVLASCPGIGPETETYTVTYDGNGSDGGTVPTDSNNYEEGASVTVLGNTGNLSKNFYSFSGWNTQADGTSTGYIEGETFPMGISDITLYAQWTEQVAKRDIISVPGGSYVQTDTGGHSFTHNISGFSIAKYEVTYELWYTVHNWALSNGYHFANPGREGHDGTITDPAGEPPTSAKYEPVTYINWRDAIVWCNAYSQMSGFSPVYKNGSSEVIKDSRDSNEAECDAAVPDWSANGYRLPTEGEWQYAASYQDGTNWTPYNYASGATEDYTDPTATGLVAWYNDNSSGKTHDVGTKTANQIVINDMSGNVSEWCWDWYGAWPTTEQTDYRGPGIGSTRVARGGSWSYSASYLQVGDRYDDDSYNEANYQGFRPMRTP